MGATLNVQLSPGGTQCFSMPASGWSSIGTGGYKYKDSDLANGPVKIAIVKGQGDRMSIKVIAKNGGATPIRLTPGNPTLTYAANLRVTANFNAPEYCSSTGTASPTKNDSSKFQVKNDTGTACMVAACSPSGAFLDPRTLF